MARNQIKRSKGTVVETEYVKKRGSRGEVKVVAKHRLRQSLKNQSSEKRITSQVVVPETTETTEIPPGQHVQIQPSSYGKVCHCAHLH